MSATNRSFHVSVPATSANLGPGFDAVGMALALRVRADVTRARRFALEFVPGPNAPSHNGFEAAVLCGMRRIDGDLPRVRVRVSNDIPLGKGLGSSAAASVLGLAIAARAHGIATSRRRLAHLACELEGHPDNALPAVLGGVVIAVSSESGAYVRLRVTPSLRALVVVPNVTLTTRDSRALLPNRYERADVVFTAQRAALLGAALASGSWNELREAMRDRMHQPYRASRIPGMQEALAVDARGMIGSALSGAGPSLIALCHPEPFDSAQGKLRRRTKHLVQLLEACFTRAGVAARTLELGISTRGLSISANGKA